MADKKPDKDRGSTPEPAAPKPRPPTTGAPFDDIIDAILGADAAVVREHQKQRRKRKKKD
jgi:hypothetical protein